MKYMFDFIKKFFTETPALFLGVRFDNRADEEKKDDIKFSEIVAKVNAVNWTEKPRESWRQFPSLDQHQSSMCVANSFAKVLGIAYGIKYDSYIPFSRSHIYQRRGNKIEGGMGVYEIDLIGRQGVTLEQLTPKEIFRDTEADAVKIENFKKDVGKIFTIGGLVYLESDIETIASIIQTTGKGVMLFTYFTHSEWSKEYPIIENNNLNIYAPSTSRHAIVAVDFTLWQGKKCLIIEDSAWFGGINRRILSEEWINKRIFSVSYPMNFKFEISTAKLSYTGTIISLQTCLQNEGLFPSNISKIESFGPITRQALLKFQQKYSIPVNIRFPLDNSTENKLILLYP